MSTFFSRLTPSVKWGWPSPPTQQGIGDKDPGVAGGTLLNDREICERAEQGMISPYEPTKIRQVDAPSGGKLRSEVLSGVRYGTGSALTYPVISYGSSSYGYDLRLSGDDFRIFQHVPGLIVDPKKFNERCLKPASLVFDSMGSFFVLPAHTYALGVVLEHLSLPDDVTAFFIGKSSYARCGIIVNTTPGEAGWKGYLTLEISNSSGADVRIYANEGICQALFFRGNPCNRPYGDGKYQNQTAGVTLAKV